SQAPQTECCLPCIRRFAGEFPLVVPSPIRGSPFPTGFHQGFERQKVLDIRLQESRGQMRTAECPFPESTPHRRRALVRVSSASTRGKAVAAVGNRAVQSRTRRRATRKSKGRRSQRRWQRPR